MSDRLFALNFLFLSSIFAAIELFLAVYGGMDAGFMLLVLSLALAAAGVLVSLRTLVGQREQAESVSERRRRAREDSMMRERLKAYPSDDDFFSASACASGDAPIDERPSTLGQLQMEKESFQEYIGRSMSAPEEEDEVGVGPMTGGTMPSDFSHGPSSAIESLKRAGGKS
ncbi:MAG: hypothetical protein RAO75_01080 [Candidatus Chlorobium antarcticum]|nr:hypothetical protein [Candidatus Chlorobium antarcticum]